MYVRTYETLDECTVKMTPELAKLCEPYNGCPRGMMGVMPKTKIRLKI